MTSLSMTAIGLFLRLTARPKMATAERALRVLQKPKKSANPPAKLAGRHSVSVRTVHSFDCWTIAPRNGTATRAAVYLHGGAYISGMSPQHWSLIGQLADAGVHVEVPLYGLAPQHTYLAAYDLVTAVYRQLLGQYAAEHVTVAGDSAGGGLTLGFAQTLLDIDLPQPARLVLVSPWLDLTLGNPQMPAVEKRDPWLSSAGLVEAGMSWAGGDDPAVPRLSPINGSLAGLAPMSVWIGTRDLFFPDVQLLQQRAEAAGVPFDLTVGDGAIHVYPLIPAPEGREAARHVVATLSD